MDCFITIKKINLVLWHKSNKINPTVNYLTENIARLFCIEINCILHDAIVHNKLVTYIKLIH